MKPKYFLIDLDGTLLRSDGSVSDFTVEVINKALRVGHIISFATARSLVSAKPIVGQIDWVYPIVLYNGALIVDPQAENILHGQFTDTTTAIEVLDLGRQFGLAPFVFGIDSLGTQRVWYEDFINDGQRKFAASRPGDPRFRLVERVHVDASNRILMLTYIATEEQLLPFKDEIDKRYVRDVHVHFTRDTYLHDYFFLEVAHVDANKECATKKWAELVGCSPTEITAFGDNLNDLGLLRGAGQRVVVSNAHEELKRIADVQIDSNDNDGVAVFINEMLSIGVSAGVR